MIINVETKEKYPNLTIVCEQKGYSVQLIREAINHRSLAYGCHWNEKITRPASQKKSATSKGDK